MRGFSILCPSEPFKLISPEPKVMRTLGELRQAVESVQAKIDSRIFHEATGEILEGYLDFEKALDTYQVDPMPPSQVTIQAKDMAEVKSVYDRLLSEGINPKNYVRRLTYTKPWEAVVAFSHHKTLDDLTNARMFARSILSTTSFGLENPTITYQNLARQFGPVANALGREALALAFDEGYIVRAPNCMYSLHPRHLVQAAEKAKHV
jgi:hypothetical protein